MEPRLGYLVFTAPLDPATRRAEAPSASGSDLWMPGSGPRLPGLTLCQPLPGVLARVVTRLVREPEGNGCAGRFVRTPKESLRRVHRFDGIEELRQTLHGFKNTYNRTSSGRHRCRTPAQIRAEQFGLPEAAWCKTRCLTSVERYTRFVSPSATPKLSRTAAGSTRGPTG